MEIRVCKFCEKSYEVKPRYRSTNIKFCSWGCYSKGRKGVARKEARYSWGYRYIFKPEHVGASFQGYVAEHRLVCEIKLGRQIESHEVVHHINGKRGDNSPENLIVCSRREHYHADKKMQRTLKRNQRLSCKKVGILNQSGDVSTYYKSITEAAKKNGVSISAISRALQVGRKSAGKQFVFTK